ncbi:hypothetical protein BH24ACT3_BH24ACT3_07530 [soil metagenome]
MTRSLDPQGKRALFEKPVAAAPDNLAPGKRREGKEALYSTGPPRSGTAVVACSSCRSRTRLPLSDVGVRLLTISAWLPGRTHGHWMRCPACDKRTWCAIGWQE